MYMDPYKYVLITSIKRTSNPSKTVRALLYKCSIVSNKLYTLRRWATCPKLLILLISVILPAYPFSILTNHLFFSILPHFVVRDLHHFCIMCKATLEIILFQFHFSCLCTHFIDLNIFMYMCLFRGFLCIFNLFEGSLFIIYFYKGLLFIMCLYWYLLFIMCLYKGLLFILCLYKGLLFIIYLYMGLLVYYVPV